LYKKADIGSLVDFTGVGLPYEAPTALDVHLNTQKMNVEESVNVIFDELLKRNIILG
jgi:adenylylsulfate kinase-like enzyme